MILPLGMCREAIRLACRFRQRETHLFEALQAVDHFAAEEGASIFQSRFVYNDGGSFPLDSRNTAKMQPEIRFLRLTRKQIRYKLTVTNGFMGCIMSSALICRATDPEIRDSFITKRRMIPMALVTSTEMFKKAYDGGYAIGAFNVNNMEIVQGITEAAQELKSPVILQASAGARKYANPFYLQKLVEAAVLTCPDIDIVMHLDHGPDFETCKSCVDSGFTSVMIDCSSKPFEENIAITKQVVEYAHAKGAVVEAELGALAGIEDDVNVSAADSAYTRPEEVQEFVERTGVDSLAIAIGTSHGAFKFKPGTDPKLRFDILDEIVKNIPGFPIVLHGASSVPQEYVKIINEHGGKLKDAIGVPEEQLRQAARSAVCKINVDSDLRLGFTAGIREMFDAKPDVFDPRGYLKPARENVKAIVMHKIQNVLGSAGKM